VLLSRTDVDAAAVRAGEANDTITFVENDERVDDTTYWRPVVDDGVEASELKSDLICVGQRVRHFALVVAAQKRGTDNTPTGPGRGGRVEGP